MDRESWDERYRSEDLVWGVEPNRFVASELADARPRGRALDLACGEGRNAIWLASRGWQVDALDFSSIAIERARKLAESAGVEVRFEVGDATRHASPPETYSLVLISYLQVPGDDFGRVLKNVSALLAPGGELFMIGHAVRNLSEGVGGPRDPAVLWDPDTLRVELEVLGLEVERCEHVLRPVKSQEGSRDAIDVLVRAHRSHQVDPQP